MEYRFLGRSGLRVSALSFGAWVTFGEQVDNRAATECMLAAYEAGVNFFDNAEAYAQGKAETVMGEIIRQTSWKRSDLVISTKLFWGGKGENDNGLSFKHIQEGVDASLKRLQLEYVDLIYCHRPDIYTPVEETVWAMNQVIRQGKAFYWGTSEWSAVQLMEAYSIAARDHLIPPTMEQPEYNLFRRDRIEKDYLPFFSKYGLGTTTYSPLASGLLSGKYNHGIPEGARLGLPGYEWLRKRLDGEEGQRKLEKIEQLSDIAKELDCSLAQLAIAWCLKNPNVSTVILGATSTAQLQENLAALEIIPQLSQGILDRIEAVIQNKPKGEIDWRHA